MSQRRGQRLRDTEERERVDRLKQDRAFFEARVRKLHADGCTDGQLIARLGDNAKNVRRKLGLQANPSDGWGDL